jgi:hypothetical protein
VVVERPPGRRLDYLLLLLVLRARTLRTAHYALRTGTGTHWVGISAGCVRAQSTGSTELQNTTQSAAKQKAAKERDRHKKTNYRFFFLEGALAVYLATSSSSSHRELFHAFLTAICYALLLLQTETQDTNKTKQKVGGETVR